jgi:hypothetical protein
MDEVATLRMALTLRDNALALALTPTPDVFLCHSSKDKEIVKRLARDLERLGIRPWFDLWEIGPGDSLIDKIGAGLNTSKVFCVLISQNSISSNWCNTELRDAIYRATETGNSNIIPLKCGDVSLPVFLRDKLYVDMTRYSLKGLLYIASRIYGITPKAVATFLDTAKLTSISVVSDFIIKETKDRRVVFGSSEWEIISEIFKRRGIDISDTIDIFDRRTGKTHLAS